MPVSPAFAESNRVQTERLRTLVGRLDAEMLAVRLPNGWAVAVALAHVAFWDRQRLCLMRRWAAGADWCNGVAMTASFDPGVAAVLGGDPAGQGGREMAR